MFNSKKWKIRQLGDPVLSGIAREIPEVTPEIRELAAVMIDAMHKANGIGLAGNQVGELKRIVVLDVAQSTDDDDKPIPFSTRGEAELIPRMPITLINPEILSFSEEKVPYEEGCLSVPKIYAEVVRSARVLLKSRLLDGEEIILECGGLLGRAVQHELDHLDGKVFVQKVADPHYGEIEPLLNKMLRKNGRKNFKVKRLI